MRRALPGLKPITARSGSIYTPVRSNLSETPRYLQGLSAATDLAVGSTTATTDGQLCSHESDSPGAPRPWAQAKRWCVGPSRYLPTWKAPGPICALRKILPLHLRRLN